MPRVTLNRINAKLKELGIVGELVRDPSGYFYMVDLEGSQLWCMQPQTGIYMYRLNDQSLEAWIKDIQNLIVEEAHDGTESELRIVL